MSKVHLPIIGMPQVGTPGIRDINHPCEVFAYGDPKGDCETDGHYMCKECRHRKWRSIWIQLALNVLSIGTSWKVLALEADQF